MDDEDRNYIGLMCHLILCLIALGFVSSETTRLWGENPEITREQVSRALNQVCETLWIRRRGVSARRQVGAVIRYHQSRNAKTRKSHKKRRRKLQPAL